VALTSGEFALLNALVGNAGQPMKRERLLELTRGESSESFDRAIDVQIHRLRRIIEADPAHPRYLQTVWGVGYVFVPDVDSASEGAKPCLFQSAPAAGDNNVGKRSPRPFPTR
jgi:two-component system phosphate regulon response regulator OmpR